MSRDALFENDDIAGEVIANIKTRKAEIPGGCRMLPKAHEDVASTARIGLGGKPHIRQDAEPTRPKDKSGARNCLLETQRGGNTQPVVLTHLSMLPV